ncbi:hypothetical protein [Acidobacterium sp. S8]|uniref:hypothetical protein n=1 Tax=Acidobacterium sp. S8 TaxID=1641854 RepID=UPI00131E91B8|nr:hypothetical protein [Acidobacterium sp. S8]
MRKPDQRNFRPRVLVADDHAIVAEGICALLVGSIKEARGHPNIGEKTVMFQNTASWKIST